MFLTGSCYLSQCGLDSSDIQIIHCCVSRLDLATVTMWVLITLLSRYSLLCSQVGPCNCIYVGLMILLLKYSIFCSQLDFAICLNLALKALISKLFTIVSPGWTLQLYLCGSDNSATQMFNLMFPIGPCYLSLCGFDSFDSSGPFLYNAGLKMRPKYPQLDLSRTMLN